MWTKIGFYYNTKLLLAGCEEDEVLQSNTGSFHTAGTETTRWFWHFLTLHHQTRPARTGFWFYCSPWHRRGRKTTAEGKRSTVVVCVISSVLPNPNTLPSWPRVLIHLLSCPKFVELFCINDTNRTHQIVFHCLTGTRNSRRTNKICMPRPEELGAL